MSDRDRKSRFKGPKTGGRGGDHDRESQERHQSKSSGKPHGKPQGGRPAWRDREAKGGFKGHAKGDGPVILYGWHSVTMALANPQRRIRKLFVTENVARRLTDEKIDTRVPPELVHPGDIDRRLGPDAVHQGLLAEADPLPGLHLDELPQDGIVLVLDQITDPHNVGAILRSAAAFGVKAIVTTGRHSPEATGVLAKSASGALELVPIVEVPNLHRALGEMNDAGFLTVGLDSEGQNDLSAVPLHAPLALVLGAEGKGLRQLTRETCSVVARMDMPGRIKSLNVSNAAALALYIGTSRLGLMD
jgi:23S rRNA (guanosine2251-2'-O)-methyltransferase